MILVTGAAGFIGSHLVEALQAGGYRFRSLVRRAGCRLPGEVAVCDLVRGEGLEAALRGVDVVVHLAGVTKALCSLDYYTGNALATQVLARALAGRNIRFVHVSSLAASGPSPDGSPLTEEAETHPITDYGKSKLEAEHVVRTLLPDATIVRPPVVYGPRDTGVWQVLRPLTKGWGLEIRGGERWFSTIYVTDLVNGLLAAAFQGAAAGRTYFLAHPKPVSWSELAASVSQIIGRPVRVLRIPPAAARTIGWGAELWAKASGRPGILSRDKIREAQCPYWTCAPRRAAAELGFEASTDWPEGLAQTLAWYKGAGWLHY
jgi:nucleoside-diphosphate-sugar epimerase